MGKHYTQDDINALARALGADEGACPGLWLLDESPYGKAYCTLPSPLSDDPAAALWDGPLLRKLPDGFFVVCDQYAGESTGRWVVRGPIWYYEDSHDVSEAYDTPTAALLSAYLSSKGQL